MDAPATARRPRTGAGIAGRGTRRTRRRGHGRRRRGTEPETHVWSAARQGRVRPGAMQSRGSRTGMEARSTVGTHGRVRGRTERRSQGPRDPLVRRAIEDLEPDPALRPSRRGRLDSARAMDGPARSRSAKDRSTVGMRWTGAARTIEATARPPRRTDRGSHRGMGRPTRHAGRPVIPTPTPVASPTTRYGLFLARSVPRVPRSRPTPVSAARPFPRPPLRSNGRFGRLSETAAPLEWPIRRLESPIRRPAPTPQRPWRGRKRRWERSRSGVRVRRDGAHDGRARVPDGIACFTDA